jgi:3-isopropylmalate/(R)-2-methylmalate dehydratase small subunit
MALAKIEQVTGTAVFVPGDDIDTDRIIPARFMKCVTFDGLGQYMFHDVRFTESGGEREHPLNDPRFAGAKILLSGANFGCGSSREHAPQAIAKSGFQAVIAESFAEIFFGNSTTLGMPCVSLSHDQIAAIAALIDREPKTNVTVDLVAKQVRAGDLAFSFDIKPGARDALIQGQWDPIGQLLDGAAKVKETASRLPYLGF